MESVDNNQSHLDKIPSLNLTNVNEVYSAKALEMRKKYAEYASNKRTRAIRVKRDFILNGRIEELSKPVSKDELKHLLCLLTKDANDNVLKLKATITAKIEKMLKQFIPRTVKVMYSSNKNAFVKHTGFTYESSKYYGSHRIFIEPDIPNVFSEVSEMEILKARFSESLNRIDVLVEKYHDACKSLTKLETKLAIKFSKVKNINNLIDLNIDYYELYKKQFEDVND